MHPVLLTISNFSISSFGAFLSLAFLIATFTIWRLCRFYDLSEEKTLDISLLTFFGGLIGARVCFIISNLSNFDSLSKVFLINKYPGLNFWGALLGGGISLIILSRRFKINFWILADFLMVGVFAGLIFGSVGCLLGSCQSGFVSNSFLAVPQIGLIGARFPIQLFETVFFALGFWWLWRAEIKFHWNGKITSISLILLGLIKFLAEFFRGNVVRLTAFLTLDQLLAILTLILGFTFYYKQGNRSLLLDVKVPFKVKFWKITLPKLRRSWYNRMIDWRLNANKNYHEAVSKSKELLKNLNVKSQPPKFR